MFGQIKYVTERRWRGRAGPTTQVDRCSFARLYIDMYACLYVCLIVPVCLHVCMPVFLSVCMFVCQYVVCLYVCMSINLYDCLCTHIAQASKEYSYIIRRSSLFQIRIHAHSPKNR